MRGIRCTGVLIALLASATVLANIAGTYELEYEGKEADRRASDLTLTFAVDDQGNYSARVSSQMGDHEGTNVEVDGSDFSFSVIRKTSKRDYLSTYSGTVKNGKLTGTLTIGHGDDVRGKLFFSAKLKGEEPLDEATEEKVREEPDEQPNDKVQA